MTDRELLERAANAAGYELDYTIRPDGKAFYHSDRNAMALADGGWFSSLTDDGDALRLAVKLQMSVTIDADFTKAGWKEHQKAPTVDGNGPWYWKEWHSSGGGDVGAATRMAITFAAAKMAP